jgi:hypothetical protein
LSIDGAEDLPEDIVDNLSDDLPLLDDDVLPDLPDLPNLPDLPIGSTRDNLLQDTVPEAGEVIDGASDAVNDTVDSVDDAADGVKDVGSEVGKTVEEAKKLLP